MRSKIYLESESQTPTILLQNSFKKISLSTRSEQVPKRNFEPETKTYKFYDDSVFPSNNQHINNGSKKDENLKAFENRITDRYSNQEFIAYFKEDLNENLYMNRALENMFRREKYFNAFVLFCIISVFGLACLLLKNKYLCFVSFVVLIFLRIYSIESS